MRTNLDRAALVSKHVQLQSVSLVEAGFESLADPMDEAAELDAEIYYRAEYEVKKGHVIANVHFVLHAHPKGHSEEDSERPVIANLRATYALVYLLVTDEELPEDAFDHFATLNGTYNAWPYWRELVHTVSGRAGLAAFVVPVWRPQVQLLEPEDDEEESPARAAVES